MNKKNLWSITIVLAISVAILYIDLKATPFKQIIHAASSMNWSFFGLIFVMMLLSYTCEALILSVLAKRKGEPKRGFWSFFRIPIIQTLFNAITPMSTGGQPAQLTAMIQMGIEGGRATSLLLMKFIVYQICVFLAYVSTIATGFHLVKTKFSTLAIFIVIGLLIHVVSTLFLLAIMFAYNFTKSATIFLMKILRKIFPAEKVDKWQENTISKIDTFYGESRKLKNEKQKLLKVTFLTILQLLLFYSIPYVVLLALNVHASWLEVTQMNIMITMIMAIVPIPGASGGAEYSFQTLFSTFISSSGTLVLGMFLWRLATYFFGIILGIFGWSIKPKKISSSKIN